MEGKLLHIIGGGYNQVPLVNKAKAMGLKVLVTDLYDNPPCRILADFYEKIDTTDKESTYKAAVKHKIDFVATDQTDVAVPTTAYIAEKLNLPGIGYQTSLRFTNKYLMREALKHTLPLNIPQYYFFNTPSEGIKFCKSHPKISEFIVKPINSQGSKGVYKLNQVNFVDVISSAFVESKSRGILIEQYLEGFEYSVEAYKDGPGKTYNIALTKKYHYNSNDCIDERNAWLGDTSEELEASLFDLNRKVIEALELPFGITHAEYKVFKGRPYLIEIAARGGGGGISSKIVPFLTGFEPEQALLNKILGIKQDIKIDNYKNRFAVLKFFNLKPGKIKHLHVNRNVIKDVFEFNLDIKEGDFIKVIKDSRDRPGYFIVNGLDREKVLEKEKEVEEAVQVEYEKN